MENKKINILAISGSLRANSSNTSILRKISVMVPDNVDYKLYDGLGDLPHFSPTPDDANSPKEVKQFRSLLSEADGVLICTPEYAFGVPGVLKNALDWTVSSGELTNKPVALITASTGGDKAHASLLLTLQALSAAVVQEGKLLIQFVRTKVNEKGDIVDPSTSQAIRSVVDALVNASIQYKQMIGDNRSFISS